MQQPIKTFPARSFEVGQLMVKVKYPEQFACGAYSVKRVPIKGNAWDRAWEVKVFDVHTQTQAA